MADKYFIKAANDVASVVDPEINDFTTYLSLIGVSESAVDVTKVISSNCISNELSKGFFDNNSEAEFTGAVMLNSKDDHEGKVEFKAYQYSNNKNKLNAILAGTSPHFKNKFCEIGSPGTYNIKRAPDGSSLQIGTNYWYPSNFADNVVPLRVIAVLQGAGGGGGGGNLVANGSGGGSGGLIICIIYLDRDWTIEVGAGGAGGNNTGNSSNDKGKDGGATTLTFTNIGGIKISALGGKGGNIASDGGKGGGIYDAVAGAKIIGRCSGGSGGKGAGLGGTDSGFGTRLSDTTIYCTDRNLSTETNTSFYCYGCLAGESSGNTGGGGGGSYFGHGGEGTFENGDNHKNGSYGSGGGGATWGQANGKGGNGGDGLFRLYY